MTELFLQTVNLSYSAVWIVLAVVVLRLLLKKAPKWTYVLLWALVAARLLVPFSVESPLSLQPSAQVISPTVMEAEIPEIHTGLATVNSFVNPKLVNDSNYYVNPMQKWIPRLAAIWGIGMAGMAIYMLLSYILLKRRIRGATQMERGVYCCEGLASAFVLGLFLPKIYLPADTPEADLPYVLAHERAHIHRKDHWWKPMAFLLLTIHWFNPMLWLAYVLLCRDLELACDERVVRELGTAQRADYSQALLNSTVSHRSIAACPLAFGGVRVASRIRNVLHYKEPAFWIVLTALLAVLIAAVCLLTVPKTYDTPEYGVFSRAECRYMTEKAVLLEVGHTEDGQLWIDGIYMGEPEPYPLTTGELKDYAARDDAWQKGYRLGEVETAWILRQPDLDDQFYLLVRTSRGELLLGRGREDRSERGQGASDDTCLYWLCSLRYEGDFRIPATECWVDYRTDPAGMKESETTLPEFPGAIFRYTPGQVTVVQDGTETELITGMPIWNVFFSDLTGDRVPEICATVSFGSGVIDEHVVVHDLAEGETYTLWERGEYDYTLLLEHGELICERRKYPHGELVKRGPLAMAATSFVPWTMVIADTQMVPTQAALSGVFDHFLFLKGADGQTYRYERADVYGETLTKGALLDSFVEQADPKDVSWQVYAFVEIPDCSSVLAVADGVYPFRYDYSPPRAVSPAVLQQAKDNGCAVMEDGEATYGQQHWQAFYDTAQAGKPASVQVARWFTLDPAHCDAAYYAANREDYPTLSVIDVSYDGQVYRLHWEENGTSCDREYRYLMRYETQRAGTDSREEPETVIRYVFTNDDKVTWEELWYGLFSSAMMARPDSYFIWTETP